VGNFFTAVVAVELHEVLRNCEYERDLICAQKCQICCCQICSFMLQMHQNSPWTPMGELTTLPRHPSRRGRATPSPNTLPSVDACCVSVWAPTAPRLSGPQHGPTKIPGYAYVFSCRL